MQGRGPFLNGRQGANAANGEGRELDASGYLGLEQMTTPSTGSLWETWISARRASW
jgi:hypothetical protein